MGGFKGEGNSLQLKLSPIAKDNVLEIQSLIVDSLGKPVGKEKVINKIIELLDGNGIKHIAKEFIKIN